jgi:hypothetical protein
MRLENHFIQNEYEEKFDKNFYLIFFRQTDVINKSRNSTEENVKKALNASMKRIESDHLVCGNFASKF